MDLFITDRFRALRSLDEPAIRAYFRKWTGDEGPKDPEVFWERVHRARLGIPGLDAAERVLSRRWLNERGVRLELWQWRGW